MHESDSFDWCFNSAVRYGSHAHLSSGGGGLPLGPCHPGMQFLPLHVGVPTQGLQKTSASGLERRVTAKFFKDAGTRLINLVLTAVVWESRPELTSPLEYFNLS